jgi:hypothetical protein
MSTTDTLEPAARTFVEAVVRYTDPSSEGAMLYSQDHENSTFKLIPKTVRIHDARKLASELSFERNGFTLIEHRTDVDLQDKAAVEQRYYPEAARIVRELTGASEVLVFLDVIRSEVREEGAEPANNAHVDFDQRSIHSWVKMMRPDDAPELLKKRILNINLWRGIKPVERMPLAVCDARTVSRGDLIKTIIGQREGGPDGPFSGFNLGYNPAHRWCYYPDMQPHEVLAFKLFDSEMDRPHLTAHTAFVDPTSRDDAPTRLSHEIRTIAFLER